MSKRRGSGGFGGPSAGGLNMNAMLKQLQEAQDNMKKVQEALAEETLEVQAGGGAVTVVITGHQRVKSISLKPELLDTSDPEWANDLQDLLIIAVNQAIEMSQQRSAERMEAASGNLTGMLPPNLSGLLGG